MARRLTYYVSDISGQLNRYDGDTWECIHPKTHEWEVSEYRSKNMAPGSSNWMDFSQVSEEEAKELEKEQLKK